MKLDLQLLLFLSMLLCVVKAQQPSSRNDSNPLHPSMAVVLTVLFIMFLLSFLTVAYAKFCSGDRPMDVVVVQDPGGAGAVSRRFSGIDKKVIESLPFFPFSSLKGMKDGLECAVCLSRFEETEILRLLPKCRHAFHMDCIDMWLENHSSCPLCRYKFDVGELTNVTFTNSLRYTSGDEPNLQFFIEREQNQARSARFSVSSAIQKLSRSKREEPLIQDFKNENCDRKVLHNFKHRIVASDVIYKSRWSDVNSSDLMSLNSEMLNFMSSKRFSAADQSGSRRFNTEISLNEQNSTIKADSAEASAGPRNFNADLEKGSVSNLLDTSQKRSMSEITYVSRFKELNAQRRISMMSTTNRRLWFQIAKKTILRFAGRETSSDTTKRVLNV